MNTAPAPQRFFEALSWMPWMGLVFGGCVALFFLWPDLDLVLASHYYDAQRGFLWADHPWVLFSYRTFAKIHWLVLVGGILAVIYLRFFSPTRRQHWRSVVFMLCLMVLGPGLVVNAGFKDHWGRARPAQVHQLGGDKLYTPPQQMADQCQRNCSFVSGHASMGFLLLGLAWVTGRRRWVLAGALLGGFVGLGRMLQGGHFFSDVVFSFWAVYFTALVLGALMHLPPRKPEAACPPGVAGRAGPDQGA